MRWVVIRAGVYVPIYGHSLLIQLFFSCKDFLPHFRHHTCLAVVECNLLKSAPTKMETPDIHQQNVNILWWGWYHDSGNTVECRYNPVQFITILPLALRWQQQNVNQTSNSQQTPHNLPSWVSYGVSIVGVWEKIDCIIMAPHCNALQIHRIIFLCDLFCDTSTIICMEAMATNRRLIQRWKSCHCQLG